MYRRIEPLLHQRVKRTCEALFLDSHFPQAAAEAFKQAELALQEATAYPKYGRSLVQHAFGSKPGLRLTVKQDKEATKAACAYFDGALAYYRNHAVHVGTGIDDVLCARALIVASDLLDLLQAAQVHFSSPEELAGLASQRGFASLGSLRQLLRFLDAYVVRDLVVDGLFEELANRGWGQEEYEFVFEVDLMHFETVVPGSADDPDDIPETGQFRLTTQGAKVLAASDTP